MLVTDLLEAGFFALESSLFRATHLHRRLWGLIAHAFCWPTSGISSALLSFRSSARLAGLDVHPLLGEPTAKTSTDLFI